MSPAAAVKYPEHEKLHKVKDESQAIGEFLDRFTYRGQGVVLASYHTHGEHCTEKGRKVCGFRQDELYPILGNINSLLAEHFGIDLNKLDDEKRAMLEELRRPS